jgi:uncharacterized protein
MTDRKGDWIQTSSGRMFWPMDPRAEDVCIEDIAHALALLCRYGGHCLRFYSVAEHCVLLSRYAPPEHKLWALMHDASEAYLVDVPRPIKYALGGYREAEKSIMGVICDKFGLSPSPEVDALDTAILMDERTQNMATAPQRWCTDGKPLGIMLKFWDPVTAELEFLRQFHMIKRGES